MKEQIYEQVKQKIWNYLDDEDFNLDGDNFDDKARVEWEIDGYWVEAELNIYGTLHISKGDYWTPDYYERELVAEVEWIEVRDSRDMVLLAERKVKELTTTYNG